MWQKLVPSLKPGKRGPVTSRTNDLAQGEKFSPNPINQLLVQMPRLNRGGREKGFFFPTKDIGPRVGD